MNIQISYGRKIPGAQEYSSESYHITISQDLPDDSEDGDIRHAINALHELAKQEVDERLQQVPARPQLPPPTFPPRNGNGFPQGRNGGRFQGGRTASSKQVNYMLGLANQTGLTFEQLGDFLVEQTGKNDPYALTAGEASRVIDALKGA